MPRVVILLALPSILIGCEWIQEVTNTTPVEPPPTVAEIETIIRDEAGLGQDFAAENWQLPEDRGLGMTASLTDAVAEYTDEEHGPVALRNIKLEIKSHIRKAKRADNWQAVLLLSDALDILAPDESRYTASRNRAEEQLGKPEITIRMIFEDKMRGETAMIADFYIPLTQERTREVLRVGDIVHGTQFIGPLKRLKGARFEYLPTFETFVVMGAHNNEW
jgi:hypothetical protein